MKIDGECLIELIGSCRNKVQISRSVRMPQLHTSLHFHLTPIVMINGSSRHDLILDSQYFCRSIPAGTENPSLSQLCYQRLWGSRNRRALILGWAYYLDAFSSYPLRTWLPSVYRGHDNWYTRGASFPGPLVLGERSSQCSNAPHRIWTELSHDVAISDAGYWQNDRLNQFIEWLKLGQIAAKIWAILTEPTRE
uniref:Uncharacterized protein n=1 Tax=Nymphaea colorata TaxID=210225 RepID=A0A5K1HRX4_9MAGN|nr:unnamed protein product [Nymphaea colorata]